MVAATVTEQEWEKMIRTKYTEIHEGLIRLEEETLQLPFPERTEEEFESKLKEAQHAFHRIPPLEIILKDIRRSWMKKKSHRLRNKRIIDTVIKHFDSVHLN